MREIGFAGRLAYLRWLRTVGREGPETDAELAAALGVGVKWLRKWKRRAEAPEGRTEALAIATALEAMGVTVGWLYDGKGPTPRPKLWREWLVARELGGVEGVERFLESERDNPGASAPSGASKAAGGTRGRTRPR